MAKQIFYLITMFVIQAVSCTAKGPNQITMTTNKLGEVTIYMAGSNTVTIDWGDGTENEKQTLSAYRNEGFISSHKYNHSYFNKLPHTITIRGQNITHLSCENNQLTNLDVSNNTALTFLLCSYNELRNLNISNNVALVTLYCNHNQLTNLDISNNIGLTDLWCCSNQLTSLNISKNTALEALIIENNQLISLDLSMATMLKVLNCYNNQLTSLNVNKNTSLQYLNCGSNQQSATSLNTLFSTLLDEDLLTKRINISNNPGTDNCDQSIAINKGWTVDD
ncbi:hypothetical protein LJC28_00975 [Dysgonomonas sp. OttesenSCG-928-D17]|nr:hypothetical protein [Dysgonomonas sp. OttesenSCG-928-D17]